jgi:tetratricopeptide (TPR) repeat protein
MFALLSYARPEGRYREQGFKVSRDAIAAGVDNYFVHGNFRIALFEAGRVDEAVAIGLRAERHIRDPVALARYRAGTLARLHFHHQEYAKADEAWSRVFALVPPREGTNFSVLGRTKLGLGQYDQAVSIYRDGLKRLPKNCQLWQELGSAQAARGRPEDITAALATFDQGIAAVPKCGLTYNAAARLLIQQGRPAEARAKLETLIKQAPNSDGAVIAKEILAGIATKP